jgi:hypothetical protein
LADGFAVWAANSVHPAKALKHGCSPKTKRGGLPATIAKLPELLRKL